MTDAQLAETIPDPGLVDAAQAEAARLRLDIEDAVSARPGLRPWTPDRRTQSGKTIIIKRACNGCGELVGDVTAAELDAGMNGETLPDVRAECIRCLRREVARLRGERPPAPARKPSVVADDHVLYETGDLALALGGSTTSWTAQALRLVAKSDREHREMLRDGIGHLVEAYERWRPWSPAPTAGEFLAELDAR